ncbi:MAG: hypothetical protein JWR33_649 [Naasia sp.]|uniref:hypothetical protein n=1 Tax=Naasia sp. TaxID=2546198 RepID=UPI0026246B33|nr:hypothetical protein [Naasia sp.]MCU1569908.1 hypothetical protein [Naasia sp.]
MDATLLGYPPALNSGLWQTGHVQGIAVDRERGRVYYSFTTVLVKTDLSGALLGTVTGIPGHMGDVTFNPENRRLYASLEDKAAGAFSVAVVEVDAIIGVGMRAEDATVLTTVHLAEVARDYTGGGERARGGIELPASRYGCSGIDGITFGPRFGQTTGPQLLTVAYGVHSGVQRSDNDHQVLLQYDIRNWARYQRPLTQAPDRSGPPQVTGKYFLFTGNTRFGVQNLEYDSCLRRWFLGVYAGAKARFPNFTLFAVDAKSRPRRTRLSGLGGERGLLLALADDGLVDPATGVRGWYQSADVGLEALGNGLFYLSRSSQAGALHTSHSTLCVWTGDPRAPFRPVQEIRGRAPARRPPRRLLQPV